MLKKVKVLSGTMLIAVAATWLIGSQLTAGSSTPGTVNDPIVTRSYVDMKVGELQTLLTEMIGETTPTELGGQTTPTEPADQPSTLFTVVEAVSGQRLIAGASAELILRAGSGTVIAGAEGDGLADLTTGEDLQGGDEVPKQHHLLVSRDDGRGFLISSEGTSYILVKGDYTLE